MPHTWASSSLVHVISQFHFPFHHYYSYGNFFSLSEIVTLSWDITYLSLLALWFDGETGPAIIYREIFVFCCYLKQCQNSLRKWSLKWDPCFCLLLLTYMSYISFLKLCEAEGRDMPLLLLTLIRLQIWEIRCSYISFLSYCIYQGNIPKTLTLHILLDLFLLESSNFPLPQLLLCFVYQNK